MFSLNKDKKGFTLIEVMVVLVILGVLAAISVPMYANYLRKAKANEAINNIGICANLLRTYKMEKGSWPTDSADVRTKLEFTPSEYYFKISWKADGTSVVITAAKDKFDEDKSLIYTIDNNGKGTWSGDLRKDYADYLPTT